MFDAIFTARRYGTLRAAFRTICARPLGGIGLCDVPRRLRRGDSSSGGQARRGSLRGDRGRRHPRPGRRRRVAAIHRGHHRGGCAAAGARHYNRAVYVTPAGTLPLRRGARSAWRARRSTVSATVGLCQGRPETRGAACGGETVEALLLPDVELPDEDDEDNDGRGALMARTFRIPMQTQPQPLTRPSGRPFSPLGSSTAKRREQVRTLYVMRRMSPQRIWSFLVGTEQWPG